MLPVEQPFKTYTGLDGKPLDDGFVYFGLPNQDPIAHPVTVYWDAAGTLPALQPLRTVNGYIMNAGTPANVFYASAYSELVLDSKGRQVFYAATSDSFSIATLVQATLSTLTASITAASRFIQSGMGAIMRTIQEKLRESKSFYDFGAVGDGVADDTAAILAAIADHLASGTPLVTGAGRFKVSTQIAIDVSSLLANTGICIRGAGRRRTILISTYSSGVPFLLTGANSFFHTLRDIGFEGNYAGPVLQVGKNDFTDAFNSCTFIGLNVNNSSTNAAAEGVRLNYVLQSDVDIVSNCSGTGRPGQATTPGSGTAIVLRQVQFSRLMLAGGNASIALKLTAGYIFSNAFSGIDLEEVNTGLQIDSPFATQNSFVGGQIVATNCINNTAGSANILQSVNLSPYSGGSFISGASIVGTFINNPGNVNTGNTWTAFNTLAGTNAAALRALGLDANIQGEMYSKGLSGHIFFNDAGKRLFSVGGGSASLVNYPEVRATATGNGIQYAAAGGDDNIDIFIAPKGTGSVKVPVINLPSYANDAAAAAGGVPISAFYRNGSVIQIRVA